MSATSNQAQPHWFDKFKPFAFGGLSGMLGTSITQPIDTVKVRIQIIGEAAKGESTNPLQVAGKMLKNEGITSFYKGLDSALFRQATYGTARLGIYRAIYNWRMETTGAVPFIEKTAFSLFAGVTSALIGNPSDLALVRFQSDFTLPPEQRRNYKHVFDAFFRIIKEEGALSLWRGSAPSIARGVSVNVGQLVSFDEFKALVTEYRGVWDLTSRVYTSILSGIVCSIVALPADNLKTKLQKMKANPDGTMPYKGMLDCLVKSVSREGPFGLWVGLPTFICRVIPHSTAVLLILDYLNTHFGGEATGKK
jgi:solute carrier family 25 oxoglutarate transporter 11